MVKREVMRIQAYFRAASAILFSCGVALAAESGPCFDFGSKVDQSLRRELPFKAGEDISEKGRRESDDVTWAAVRGTVDKPLERVLELLLDHDTTKSPKVDEMTVKDLNSPQYLARHDVHYLIKPFPLVKIRWIEQWAYAIVRGTAKDPEEVVISYQKSEGTSHIERLCGSLVLRKNSARSTDLYQYEEAKATQREVDDTLNGLLGTLKTLRQR